MSILRDLTIYSRTMLGVCLVLGIVLVAEATLFNIGSQRPVDDAAGQADAAASTPVAVSERMVIPPVVTYRDIAERPLFSDTRRPQETAPDQNSTPAGQLNSAWKLTGIVVAGESSSVLVSGIRDSRTERLQAGMMLDGWRLDTVTRDQAVFSSGGRTAVLRLHEEQEAPTVTPIKRR